MRNSRLNNSFSHVVDRLLTFRRVQLLGRHWGLKPGGGAYNRCIFWYQIDGPITGRANKWGGGGDGGAYK